MVAILVLVERSLEILFICLTDLFSMSIRLCFWLHHIGSENLLENLLNILAGVHKICTPSHWHRMIKNLLDFLGGKNAIFISCWELRDEHINMLHPVEELWY